MIDYLSPHNLLALLAKTQSLSSVSEKAELGLKAAKQLKRDGELLRFASSRSLFGAVQGNAVWRSEIEARVSLRDFDGALATAQSAILIEDRLRLLAVLGRSKRNMGLPPEPELTDQIHYLASLVNLSEFSEDTITLANDILFVSPDLAIDLIERAAKAASDPNALDWALASLAVTATSEHNENSRDDIQQTRRLLTSRIKDQEARSFSAAIYAIIGDYTANEIIAEADKLERTGDKIIMLRQWAARNPLREDALFAMEYGLRIAITSVSFSPNARVFLDLAQPLTHLRSAKKMREIIGLLDGQKGAIERLGPTEDYVKLQLLIAKAEINLSLDSTRDRLASLYFEVSEISDLVVRCSCQAVFLAELKAIDSSGTLEKEEGFGYLLLKDFGGIAELLLSSTADQIEVFEDIIANLMKYDPELAVDLCLRLNTEDRRDRALASGAEAAIDMKDNEQRFEIARELCGKIVDPFTRDQLSIEVLSALTHATVTKLSRIPKGQINFWLDTAYRLKSFDARCLACCLSLKVIRNMPDQDLSLREKIINELERSWQRLDSGWRRVDVGFKITRELASIEPGLARAYLAQTEKFRSEVYFDSASMASAFLKCIKLCLRAFQFLKMSDLTYPEDFERIESLIEKIPSSGERCKLWANLSTRLYFIGQTEEARRIVTDHVTPLLHSIEDDAVKVEVSIEVAPALYYAHHRTAIEHICKLDFYSREAALQSIMDSIMFKTPKGEPFDFRSGHSYDLSYLV